MQLAAKALSGRLALRAATLHTQLQVEGAYGLTLCVLECICMTITHCMCGRCERETSEYEFHVIMTIS